MCCRGVLISLVGCVSRMNPIPAIKSEKTKDILDEIKGIISVIYP